VKFHVSFNNADPQHAKVNWRRARKDKPHFWFEQGYWRLSPRPVTRRQPQGFVDSHWRAAQRLVIALNVRINRK
jgi:hypothetical protein